MKKGLLLSIFLISILSSFSQKHILIGGTLADSDTLPGKKWRILVFGQSTAGVYTTWTMANPPAPNNSIKAFKNGVHSTANVSLDNIVTGFATHNVRNNVALQIALAGKLDYPKDTFFLYNHSISAKPSWEFSPKTTGPGEITTSNAYLDSLIAYLNTIPIGEVIDYIILKQGESDVAFGGTNGKFVLQNQVECVDSLLKHRAINPKAKVIFDYPVVNSQYDSLRLAYDTVLYSSLKFPVIGKRNISVCRNYLPSWDGAHPGDSAVTADGIALWEAIKSSNIHEGIRKDTTNSPELMLWKKNGNGAVYRETPLLIGASTHLNNGYQVQVSLTGNGSGLVIRRTETNNNGGEQTLAIDFGTDGNGFAINHSSKRRGTYVFNNAEVYGDTFLVAYKDSALRSNVTYGNNGNYFGNVPTYFRVAEAMGSAVNIGSTGTSLGSGGALDFVWGSNTPGVKNARLKSESSTPGGGGLGFWTAPDNSTFIKAMFIDKSQNIGVGTSTPNANVLFQTSSTVKGSLPAPQMTTTQATTLGGLTPPSGTMVYDNTLNKYKFWNGNAWEIITSAP